MLSNRYVRTIIFSKVLLQTGVWIRNFGVLLYVTQLTSHPVDISFVYVAEFAPIFLFAIVGGAFADRWRPKRTMVLSDLLSSLFVVAVLFAVMHGWWIALLVGTFVSASLSQFSQPSAMKLYKRHVSQDQIQGVMAISSSIVAISAVFGPVIGTLIFVRFGIEVSLMLTAILFLGSALILMSLPRDIEEPASEEVRSFMKDIHTAISYIRRHRILKTVCSLLIFTGLAAGLTQPLLIFVAIEKLGQDEQFLQWLVMANGASVVIGGAIIMGLAKKVKPHLLIVAGLIVSAVCTVGVGASSIIWLTLVLQVIGGLFYPCIQVGIQTLVMRNTKGSYIGRVTGVAAPVLIGAMVLGMVLSGVLKEVLSLSMVYATSGVILVAGVLTITLALWAVRTSSQSSNFNC